MTLLGSKQEECFILQPLQLVLLFTTFPCHLFLVLKRRYAKMGSLIAPSLTRLPADASQEQVGKYPILLV
jgi:hypothetical protein